MRPSRIFLYLLIVVFVGQLAYYYPRLPARVASHFGAAGVADSWMEKRYFVFFEAAALLVILAEFAVLPRLIEKMPNSLLNLPNKDFWLAPERRAATFAIIRTFFEWFSVALLGLFAAINELVFRANIAGENLPAGPMWLILGVFILFTAVWTAKFIRQFRTTL